MPFEPATLDWNLGDVSIFIIQNTMRGLYKVNESGQVVPDLISHVSTKNRGKTWVFQLKSGVHWSDGVPLNATHVANSLRRLLNPKTASSYAYFLFDIEGARAFHEGKLQDETTLGIRTPSSQTVEIQLESPTPHLPSILTHWVTYPIRSDLIAKWPDHWTNPEHMAFLGAYQIEFWRPQIRIQMKPNPHHLPLATLTKLEGWLVADDSTAVNLYDTGHLELMTDPGQTAIQHPHLSFRPSPIHYSIGVGKGHPLTEKRAGILALSAALNRAELPKALGAPHRPTLDYCPPEIWKLFGIKKPKEFSDTIPEKGSALLAREFLKEAGFPQGTQVPPLTLQYFNRPSMKELAEWIQAQWKKNLGLEVRLEGRDPKTYWTYLSKNPAALFLNSKGASYPDPDTYFSLFTSGNPQNIGRWSDDQYDAWVEKAKRTPNLSERKALYHKLTKRILIEKPALIPLYYRSTGYLIKPYVKNLVINPLTSIDASAVTYDEPTKASAKE